MHSRQCVTRHISAFSLPCICAVIFSSLLSCFLLVGCYRKSPPPDGMKAVYANQSIYFGTAEDSTVRKISTGSSAARRGIEPIYVELCDGRRFFFPDLPLDVVSAMADKMSQPGRSKAGQKIDICEFGYRPYLSSFDFHDKKLVMAIVYVTRDGPISAISLSEEGPYVPLNFDRKKMIEMFGEPDEWLPYHIARAP